MQQIWSEAHEQLAALHARLETPSPSSFREVAVAAATHTPEGHDNRARVLGNVARALMADEDYDEAERLLLLAAPAVEYCARRDETRQIVFGSLHALYVATGRPDEADRWALPE